MPVSPFVLVLAGHEGDGGFVRLFPLEPSPAFPLFSYLYSGACFIGGFYLLLFCYRLARRSDALGWNWTIALSSKMRLRLLNEHYGFQ